MGRKSELTVSRPRPTVPTNLERTTVWRDILDVLAEAGLTRAAVKETRRAKVSESPVSPVTFSLTAE